MLEIRMLGELSFRADGERLHSDLGANGRMLAAYLFEFPGRVHRREHLTDLFWPGAAESRARGAFNTALWRIRRLLARESASRGGANLQTGVREIVLDPESWLSIDTHRFVTDARQALKVYEAAGSCSDVSGLEQAVHGYRGAFLDGSESDWIIAERERLHTLYVACMTAIYKAHARAQRYEAAIAAARSVLIHDPYRESIQRALAILLTLNGQRAQAIRGLRNWTGALLIDIGIAPMAETVRLEQAISSGAVFDELDQLQDAYFSALRPNPTV
jgi:DNA-binding SARP family transcriptional activator